MERIRGRRASPPRPSKTAAPQAGGLAAAAAASGPVQRLYVLQRMASAQAVVQRADGIEQYGGTLVREKLKPGDVRDAVERALETTYGGVENLFEMNDVFTSVGDWSDAMWNALGEDHDVADITRGMVTEAVREIKAENRGQVLKRLAFNRVYMGELAYPYSAENLRELLEGARVYVEDADMEVVESLYESRGAFTTQTVELAAGNVLLRDEGDIVVAIDSHQNKHHSPQLPELAPYGGGRGERFASHRDLDWHRTVTAVQVVATARAAIEAGQVTRDGSTFATPKDAIDGIIYDLGITYDEDSGKFVASYHCNPVVSEDG